MTVIHSVALCLFVSMCVSVGESHRILAVFPVNVKSHNIMFDALMKGLVKRGHVVDTITQYPLKNPPPNYKVVVDLSGTSPNTVNNFSMAFVNQFLKTGGTHSLAHVLGNTVCNLLGLEVMQTFIRNLSKDVTHYDLVLTEAFAAHCYMGFGHLLKVPVVAVSSAIEYPWITNFIGNNDNPSFVPGPDLFVFKDLNFWQRLQNIYYYYADNYRFNSITEKVQTDLMRKYLSPDIPSVREIEKSVALLLVNSHPVIFGVKPVTPGLVQVGGLHIEEKDESKLSLELKKWLDESTDGVIYFSFGSMVLIETLPVDTLKSMYETFSKLAPVRVLMRIANEKKLPPGLPSNVLIKQWIPQQDVLAHPNIKVFVTHGGLMGTQEALYHGVPMVGIPLFSDQPRNVASFVDKNMAIMLGLDDLKTDIFSKALNAILTDPKYRENAKYYSKLFKDRPMSAMDTAIFWIEYVIRNGPNTLKSPALKLSWWQLTLVDIFGFILLNLIFGCLCIFYVLKLLLQKSKSASDKVKKQ
ncbi:UDP-glucuronosyltransferase 2B19-like [Copidosoma floridanum]|uniref:UDP-glucuronosyltransferase 2B19-like n=1 Tax=Copidosoma floridanum TaxID=29053 RepID=UPI000C6FBE80|nr:UDP-glucuronosyltransferase 2B19-like [Copidosoma floridanum]